MNKSVIQKGAKAIETPERIAWLFDNILKDKELQALWRENQNLLDSDLMQSLSPLEREQFLLAKTIQDDILAMVGEMSRDERMEDILNKHGIYTKLEKYIKITSDILEKALKRQSDVVDEKDKNPFSGLGNVKKITAETDEGVEIELKKEKQ